MAKKDNDNFDFETESEGKSKFDLVGFFKNLTKQQKGIILAAVIGVLVVIAIIVTFVIIGANTGNNAGTGNNNDGTFEEDKSNVTSISISTAPGKRTYYVGDNPSYAGLVITVHYGGINPDLIYYDENPDDFVFTGFDSSAPADEQVITVEYKGKTDMFTVEIKETTSSAPKLVSIHFSTYPKQVFSVDDKFSYRSGVLTCTYSDGSTVDIELKPEYMYGVGDIFDPSGEHILLPGEHVIEIEYGENGVFVQTEYTITVY